jgi:flagellar basal body-associated protein FliL
MQLKRILVSLLVAIMMISLVVVTASAEDATSTTFDVAVETSTATVDGVLVNPGSTFEVKVVIENNPGAALTQITFTYNTAVLTPVDADANGKPDIVQGDTYNYNQIFHIVDGTKGTILVISDTSVKTNIDKTGTAFTIKFAVAENAEVLSNLGYIAKANTAANVRLTTNAPADKQGNATSSVVVNPTTHHFDFSTTETVEATCLLEGGVYVACKDEGCDVKVAVSKTAALGHDEVVAPAKAATCTEDGNTEGVKCTRCDYKTYEVLPALGHTEVDVPAVSATCTTAGNEAGKVCSTCGEYTVEPTVIPALTHTTEIIPAVPATCTSNGTTAGAKCSVCGEVLVAPVADPAKGHTEVVIPAVAATCTTAGSTEGKKCSVCDTVIVAPNAIAATGHTEEVIPAVEPTTSEEGATEGKKCSVCGEILVAPETVPAKSLTWLWIVIAAVVVIGAGAAVFFFVVKKKK